MTQAQSTAVIRRRGGRGLYKPGDPARQKTGTKSKEIPEYLDFETVAAVIKSAVNPRVRLAMMLQWRAGLRVSEVVGLTPADVSLAAEPQPELKVRQGKGGKDRLVPLHPELGQVLAAAQMFTANGKNEPYIGVTRQTVDVWYKAAFARARETGALPYGRPVTTHTFRHSAARHWLLSGVPVSIVSKWLGHANLSTTMIYLQMISDPGGFMERVR